MAQLYAACRQGRLLTVRSVQLTAALTQQLDGIFQAQEAEFNDGITADIDFNGNWKPDPDEVLVARALTEALDLFNAANQNAIALVPLDVNHFDTQEVRAIFTIVGAGANKRLLIQTFSPQQLFSGHGRIALLHDGNVFRRLDEPAFALATHLLAIVNATGDVRFKSFQMLRRLFDLGAFYQQATDVELTTFCGHASISVASPTAFVADADEGIRKAVHAIVASNVFTTHTVADITAQAASIGFVIQTNNGAIEMPMVRKDAKALLSFLLDKVYQGPIGRTLLISNSNRPLA